MQEAGWARRERNAPPAIGVPTAPYLGAQYHKLLRAAPREFRVGAELASLCDRRRLLRSCGRATAAARPGLRVRRPFDGAWLEQKAEAKAVHCSRNHPARPGRHSAATQPPRCAKRSPKRAVLHQSVLRVGSAPEPARQATHKNAGLNKHCGSVHLPVSGSLQFRAWPIIRDGASCRWRCRGPLLRWRPRWRRLHLTLAPTGTPTLVTSGSKVRHRTPARTR